MQSKFKELAEHPSDIHEHLPVLRKYALECTHVTEMGVRWVCSTWAWLDAEVSVIRCYDIVDPPSDSLDELYDFAGDNGLDFEFYRADVLEVDIEPTELLFIDTQHTYVQLKQELARHADQVSKYMIFHDTTLYAHRGEDGTQGVGLWDALEEFLAAHDEWNVVERLTNNNGLTIIKRS